MGQAVHPNEDRPHTRFGGPKEWAEWMAQLERIRRLRPKVIVAGHGAVVGLEAIDGNLRHLRALLDQPQPAERMESPTEEPEKHDGIAPATRRRAMPEVHVNGVRLHYVERGSGPESIVFSWPTTGTP